jgi:DinB superfamily
MTDLLDLYTAGPALLRKAVAGMTHEQLVARPIAGKWSTLEVVCHLNDFEPVYSDRFRRVIALKTPLLMVADENEYMKFLNPQDRDLNEELAMIEATRIATARLLRTLPAEAWDRYGIHSENGKKTLADLVKSAGNHIPNHIKFIEEKRKALGV